MNWHFDPDTVNFTEFLRIVRKSCDSFSLIVRDEGVDAPGQALLASLQVSQGSTARTNEWPGTILGGGYKVDLISFHLDEGSAEKLAKVGSLRSFVGPKYPEDLTFYSRSHPVLVSISHENEFYLKEGADTFLQLKADLIAAGLRERR